MAKENGAAEQPGISQFESALGEAEPRFDPIEHAERVLDDTAFYDFSFYEFLFSTEIGYQGTLSERALATLDEFQASEGVGAELAVLMLDVLGRVEQTIRDQVKRLKRRDWDDDGVLEDIFEDFYRFRASTLPGVLVAYQTETDEGIGLLFLDLLVELSTKFLRNRLYQAYPNFYGFWSPWADYFDSEYALWREAVHPPQVADQPSTSETGGQPRIPPPLTGEEPPPAKRSQGTSGPRTGGSGERHVQ